MADLLAWYTARQQRRTGKPAAQGTLRTKASRLRVVMRTAGVTRLSSLSATSLESRANVLALLDTLAARLGPGSMRSTVDALTTLGQYALAMGWCERVALEPSDRPKPAPRKVQSVYSDVDLDLMLQASARDLRWWTFLATLMDTGMRAGEALGLKWEHLRLDQHPPYAELPTTKTVPRLVPLSTRLATEVFTPANREALRFGNGPKRGAFHRDSSVYVFPWSYSVAMRRFQHFCKVLGLPYRGLHGFRHSWATRAIGRGGSIVGVSKVLGHSSVGVTSSYYEHTSALEWSGLVG